MSKIYEALDNTLREIRRDVSRHQGEQKRLSERLESIREQLSVENEIFAQAAIKIREEKEKALKLLREEHTAADHLVTDYREKIHREKEKQQVVATDIKKYTNDKEALSSQADALSKNSARYQSLDEAMHINDDISHRLLAMTTSTRLELENARKAFEETPFYNFGRRNTLRRQVEALERRYSERVRELVPEIERELQDHLHALEQKLLTSREENVESEKREKELVEDRKNALTRRSATAACMALLTDHEFPDLASLLSKQDYSSVAPIVYEYSDQFSTYAASLRRLESLKKSEEACEQEEKQHELPITDEELLVLPECAALVSQLRVSDISRNVLFKDLLAEYRSFSQPYRKDNYRHKLYLRLLLCSFYYPVRSSGDTFVNIDEAQDIAVPEYGLLRRILGEKCVFNLYGDVNQLVYSYKGISDWDEVKEITGGNVYALNENYRNTIQITEFCNKEFHAEVYPIGISGEPVQLEDLATAVQELLELKVKSPTNRIAIIHRYGRSKIVDRLLEAIPREKASWGQVDDNLISVISVETAKGLEFDTVVVITDSLTENEKYIAFTRALDHLIVVSDEFPREDTQSDLKDEVDDLLPEISDEAIGQAEEMQLPIDPNPQPEDMVGSNTSHSSSEYDEIKLWISEAFQDEFELSPQKTLLLSYLEAGENVACTAPSGWSKSILLYAMAYKNHREGKGQTLLTAEAHLQENELVLADRLGLKAGILNGSIQAFDGDFKKEKYDVIFVPYDYFVEQGNSDEFSRYFAGKISHWGGDHPSVEVAVWHVIQNCASDINSPLFLMSKEGFPGIDLTGFKQITVESEETRRAKKIHFLEGAQRISWFSANKDLLFGQGIVYCNSNDDCKKIARALRKAKINAQAYLNSGDYELINYLTNSFSNGGLPVLVTTQQFGKNLTNPRIRFVVHYDIPDAETYRLHVDQIGKMAQSPEIVDFCLARN